MPSLLLTHDLLALVGQVMVARQHHGLSVRLKQEAHGCPRAPCSWDKILRVWGLHDLNGMKQKPEVNNPPSIYVGDFKVGHQDLQSYLFSNSYDFLGTDCA